MGTCSLSSRKHESLSVTNEKLPPFTYLSREKHLLLISHKGKLEGFSFAESMQMHPDSIISHITASYIIVLGGTDRVSGEPSKHAFAINTIHFTLQVLPDLPIGISKGNIFYEDSRVFVLNHSSPQIFSYSLGSDSWAEVQINFSHSKYRKLRNFSSYMQGLYIFLISSYYGEKINSRVYRISLKDWKLDKSDEVFEGNITAPTCFAAENTIILGGGYQEDRRPNTTFYCRRFDHAWEKIEGPEIEEYEDYPFALSKNLPIFFARDHIVVKFPHRFWVFTLNLPENLKSSSSTVFSNRERRINPEKTPKNIEDPEEHTEKTAKDPEISTDSLQALPKKSLQKTNLKIIKVKAVAPFLPSNIDKRAYLDSESSFVDSSYDE